MSIHFFVEITALSATLCSAGEPSLDRKELKMCNLKEPWRVIKSRTDPYYYVKSAHGEVITFHSSKEDAQLIAAAPETKRQRDLFAKVIEFAAKCAYYDEIIATQMADHTDESPAEWIEAKIAEWTEEVEQLQAAIEAATEE
jgi:hypothetical protein